MYSHVRNSRWVTWWNIQMIWIFSNFGARRSVTWTIEIQIYSVWYSNAKTDPIKWTSFPSDFQFRGWSICKFGGKKTADQLIFPVPRSVDIDRCRSINVSLWLSIHPLPIVGLVNASIHFRMQMSESQWQKMERWKCGIVGHFRDTSQRFSCQSIVLEELYNFAFRPVEIGPSDRPQIHENDPRHLAVAAVFGTLRLNASPDRLWVKRLLKENFQGYRLVSIWTKFAFK